jgi:dyslexia susceptibility 1 candidate gene 1 protein
MYPGLAARERYEKEPPMPKNTAAASSDGSVETKNPLWLKDKGDDFVKDKNYVSAIEAYSESLKLDSKLTAAFMNRSFCYMKVFKLQ